MAKTFDTLGLNHVPRRLREFLDRQRFWLVVLFAGLVACFGLAWSASLNASRSESARAAGVRAEADSVYRSCMASRGLLANFQTHLDGVAAFTGVLVANAYRIARATPKGDPERAVRFQNWREVRKARQNILAVTGENVPVPTPSDCEKRRQNVLHPARPGPVRPVTPRVQ